MTTATATRHPLPPRTPWTPADDARLRDLYPTGTAAEAAAALGRTVSATLHRIDRLGLTKYPRWPAEVIEQARRLNAEGCPDRVVAERMPDVFAAGPAGRDQAKCLRQRYGWPFHRDLEGKRRALAGQRRTLGVRHGGDLRALGYRRYAQRCGWPDDLPPRAVQVLNLLATGGPQTAEQLHRAMGLKLKRNSVHGGPVWLPCSARSALCHGHGTYTGLLIAKGLVVGIRRGGGPGSRAARRPDLYTLTPHAVSVRQEILNGHPTTAGGDHPQEQDRHPHGDGRDHPAARRHRPVR